MDDKDLQTIQTRAQILAVESVLAAILSALTRSPDARASLIQTLDQLPKTLDLTSIPDATPEYSDMLSAEVRDAAESLVSFLKSHLEK